MQDQADLAVIGLGVMGRNLALNIAEHGFTVAGYDRDSERMAELERVSADLPLRAASPVEHLVAGLKTPRVLLLLVPAGPPVDQVIQSLLPHLEPDDLIIDGGNSHFGDTDRRADELSSHQIRYMGVGISGGEYGARHGPSIMPGGPADMYARVKPILEAAAAKVDGSACVTYLGPGSAGHYVKMVHNGIEYGLMQLIAESYDLMKRGLGMSNNQLQTVFASWNRSELNGYLMEITADIFGTRDPKTGKQLIDVILDRAKQKGTGMWASQEALGLGMPLLTIDAAVGMRNLSARKDERLKASAGLHGPDHTFIGSDGHTVDLLRGGLLAGMSITFAQGLALLRAASTHYGYDLDLAEVARIWRGGCIIRSALLERIRAAYLDQPALPNLLLDPRIGDAMSHNQRSLREIVTLSANLGVPSAAFMASLAYYDTYRSGWLPANLIQAQRDYFGAHTYERVDAPGSFHTAWAKG